MTTELGTLPEPLKAWAKFCPADMLDFGRRAKSMARLLDMPLQKAQDLYARACGHSGRHELQELFKNGAEPGPYDDDIPAHIHDTVRDAVALVRYYRHARLVTLVSSWIQGEPKRYFLNLDHVVCDLALFSTPHAHRAAARAVASFVDGGAAFAIEGYPFGYHGKLHREYKLAAQVDAASIVTLRKGWAPRDRHGEREFDPREHMNQLREYRARQLFTAMVEETAAELLTGPHDLWLDEEYLVADRVNDTDMLLLGDVDWLVALALAFRSDIDSESEEFDNLLAAVRMPVADRIKASPTAKGIPQFETKVPYWRLLIRYQQIQAIESALSWHSEDQPVALMETGDDKRWMSISLRERHTELEQSHWQVDATLLLADPDGGPWRAVGLLTGDFIVPVGERGYDPPQEVLSEFDYREGPLYRAWELLAGLYIPRAGYASYHEWINDWDSGGAVAVLEPWIVPEHRGTETSRWLFEGFADAFDDFGGYAVDHDWRSRVDPRHDDMFLDDLGDEEGTFRPPGIIFVPLPGTGVLGYSIWEGDAEEPSARLLRDAEGRVKRRPRWDSSPAARRGLGYRLLDTVKTIPRDIVLFDPDQRPDDED